MSARALAPDLRASRLDVVHLVDLVDHLAARKQLAVVVAAVDTRYKVVDASPSVDGIAHDLPVMMMPHRRRDARVWPRNRR